MWDAGAVLLEGERVYASWTARAGPPFPAWAGPAERLRFFLRHAILAPSRHNAQPWSFEIDGEQVRVYVDGRRALPAADPQGREATIACGGALENLRIAAAHHGHDVGVEARPPRHGEPVAIARLLQRRSPTPEEEELFHAIPARRTASTFHPRPVSPEVLAELAAAAGGAVLLRRLPRWIARPVAELVAEADAIQWSSARFRREVAIWAARGRRPADRAGTCLRQGPEGSGGLLRRLLHFGKRISREEANRRLDEQTRTLLLLSSRDDGPREWLEVGRAMQRLLLRAAASGLAVSFLSQPIEVPEARRRLRRDVGEAGHPQVLLRVGHGPVARPTPRRPVDLVLRSFASDIAVDLGADADLVEARTA
jgi:nitroreductase